MTKKKDKENSLKLSWLLLRVAMIGVIGFIIYFVGVGQGKW